jgi:hypothetical protein
MAASTAQEILDKALKRKKELLSELEALGSIIETCEKLLKVINATASNQEEEPTLFKAPSARAMHAEQIAKMIDVARRIILSEKRPMQRGELRERVEAAVNFKVVGRDKNKVFGTNLWRSHKFRMIAGRGYWPIDEELPD